MSLFPTKNRLALLRAVAEGKVEQIRSIGGYASDSRWHEPGEQDRKVTVRIEALRRAGWVELGQSRTGPSMYAPRPWLITEAGRAVLDGA